MPHGTFKCQCGRKQHYPKNVKAGYVWKCRACGRKTTVVPRGQGVPMKIEKSKKTKKPVTKKQIPKKRKTTRRPIKKVVKKQTGSGCMVVLFFLVVSILTLSII